MITSTLLLSLLKFIHVWAVIMSVGNAAMGPYRRRQARITGDPQVIAGTYDIHTRSGRAVTIPWFAVTVLSGLALAWTAGIPMLATGWIAWAILLTLVVALLFLALIAPLQRRATAAADLYAREGRPEQDQAFRQYARALEPWSHAAHAIFVVIVGLMIVKPDLPTPW